MSRYLARNKEDMDFDCTIRNTIKNSKSKITMAMYLQGQEQLNLLREIIVKQDEMAKDISVLAYIVNKSPTICEQFDANINGEDISKNIEDSFKRFEMKLDDLIEYLCEEKDCEFDSELHRDAVAALRLASISAAKHYKENPSDINLRRMHTTDYILSCIIACSECGEEKNNG